MALIEKEKLLEHIREMHRLAAERVKDTPEYIMGRGNPAYIKYQEQEYQRRQFVETVEKWPEAAISDPEQIDIDLKPCPFCGSEARLIFEHGKFFGECTGCGTRGGWASATAEERSTSGTRALAAATWAQELWNRRKEK